MVKCLLIHSGHPFSTSDVYDGIKWGLESEGVQVIEYGWRQHLETFRRIANGAAQSGAIRPENAGKLERFLGFVGSADSITMAIDHEVDFVLVINGMLYPPPRAKILQKIGIPVACWGTEAPYLRQDEQYMAPFYSHWFTQERQAVKDYAHLTSAHYLPLAYHPINHAIAPYDSQYKTDVVFVGGGYPERKALLDGVDWSGINHKRIGTMWHVDLQALAANGGASNEAQQAAYIENHVSNAETTKWHRNAHIVLNQHRRMTTTEDLGSIGTDEAESCNPRIYEVPALGGFLLSDDSRPEQAELLGDANATYKHGDSADLERQIRYYLTHPDERDRLAAAQHEAIKPHHYGARARRILEIML